MKETGPHPLRLLTNGGVFANGLPLEKLPYSSELGLLTNGSCEVGYPERSIRISSTDEQITACVNGYAMTMKSIELHLLETARDVDLAIQSGLLEPRELNGLACLGCSEEVGHLTDSFVPFAVLLDARDVPWFMCNGCVADVVEPATITVSSYETLFAKDEEFDELDFDDN